MSDLNYLRVENSKVIGSYGSWLKRSDLSNVSYGTSWEGSGKKKPSAFGYGLVGTGILLLWVIEGTHPEERATWPLYQTFGSLTFLVVIGSIALGVYLIINRRKSNKLIPDKTIWVKHDGELLGVLATNDAEWMVEAADKLQSLQHPESGDWEFFASEKKISEIQQG